jgi:hypothetical protein
MTRRALCIGINNYPGTQMDLAGCVNDANDWADELGARGFKVTRLLDAQATKAAMLAAMRELIGSAAAGDTVVITFSGHGTFVPDASGDESDGLDEGLCPYDLKSGAGALLDDEIHTVFAARKGGVQLVLISDSCHSGTVTRAVPGADDAADLPRPRFMPMAAWLPPERLPRAAAGTPAVVSSGGSPFARAVSRGGDDLLLSGCKEGPNNFSFDARIRGRPNGAFTHFALKALKSLPATASYADWHAAVTPALLPSASYPQAPQLVGNVAARKRPVFG